MPWPADVQARANAAVGQIHGRFGVTVYVRRLVVSDPDRTYGEDISRVEQEWRINAVVIDREPSSRQLGRFGVTEPVDVMATFARWQMDRAYNTVTNAIEVFDEFQRGDVLTIEGVRYTVVKHRPAPFASTQSTIADVDGFFPQYASEMQIAVMANVSTVPDATPTGTATTPTDVQPHLVQLTTDLNGLVLVFDAAVDVIGDILPRLQYVVGNTVVPLTSISQDSDHTRVHCAVAANDATGQATLTYTSARHSPLASGIVATTFADTAHEIHPFYTVPVN